jgi:alkanesulfonate monooxygenase SsuD/methylene tetrahydromethanopterin reductase-like flavin-dependent oxidoreductase (luciferase family)
LIGRGEIIVPAFGGNTARCGAPGAPHQNCKRIEPIMKFGLFGSAQARRAGPDTDSSQGFRDFIDNNVEAEALGYYSTFLVEHHFTGFGQVSASLNLLTWLGARTRHLRLGTAVLVLPWHNPVLLAEQAATLDLLSGGRLDFGVGKGYRWNEFAGFCVPLEEAEERFDEALAVITKAFVSETPFSHRGKFWRYEDIVVEPPAAQKPHPPFWMGAGSERSVREVAERGYNMLLGQHSLAEEILEQVAQFKNEVETRGRRFDPMQVAVARAVHIAKDAADKQAALERRYQGHMRINALARRPDSESRTRYILDDEKEARYESAESALFGTPDEIVSKLERLRAGGVEYVIINFGGSRENIRRFAREIMPAFSDEPAYALAGK